MTYQITNKIDRISFQDSHITDFNLGENFVILNFDGAWLAHYEEQNLPLGLVIGNCELKLCKIRHSLLALGTIQGDQIIKFPDDFPENFKEILKNVSHHDNEISLEGFMTINEKDQWIIWKLDFENFEFNWRNHVTVDEWKNGSIPN